MSRKDEIAKGKEHFRVKAFTGMKEGDVMYDLDDDVSEGYGRGRVEAIFESGHFTVSFEGRQFPIMFNANGQRFDKESKKGNTRIITELEHREGSAVWGK